MYAVNLSGDEFDPDEFVLVESTGVGPMPDLQAEEEYSTALEAQLLDFRYLFEDIDKTHGMNQRLAMEAHRLVPTMADKYPLGYFTKEATATLFQPALEELHAGIWALIGAASLAIAAALWKFIRWLMGKGKKEDPLADVKNPTPEQLENGIKEAVKVAEARVETNDQVARASEDLVKETKQAVQEVGAQLHAIGTTIKTEVAEKSGEGLTKTDLDSFEGSAEILMKRHAGNQFDALIMQTNNAWFDIMANGHWSKVILSLGHILTSMESVLDQRLKTFQSIFGVTMTQGDPARHQTALHLIEQVKAPLPAPGTDYKDLASLALALHDEKALMSVNAGKKKLEPIVATEHLARLLASSQYKGLLTARVKYTEQLGHLHRTQLKLNEVAMWDQSHPAQGVGMGVPHSISDMMAEAIHVLMKDLTYLMQIQAHIEIYLDTVDRFNMKVNMWWLSVWTALGHYMAHQETPQDMPTPVLRAKSILGRIRRYMGIVPRSNY